MINFIYNSRIPRFNSFFVNPISYRKIHVFTFRDDEFEISADFQFYPSRSPHVIGSLAWGTESTTGQLFGSSEPCCSTVFDGIHKALDVATKKPLYQFDASEAGDVLSLDPTGACPSSPYTCFLIFPLF